jgi:tetratricopeptide (TPR) repeat protein
MLASAAVRAAGERVGAAGLAAAAAAGVLAFAALFFANGSDLARLVWVGSLALVVAAVPSAGALAGLAPDVRLDRRAGLFAGCLVGLAAWMALSLTWSLSPDRSWGETNRTLVYAAFAVVGLVLGSWLPRPAVAGARGAAALLGLLYGWALLEKCVPALYADYGRIARLRAPLGYWNELALLGAVGVPVALWLAAPRTRSVRERAAGAALLYGAVVVTLLTYSRVGVLLAALAALAWVLLSAERVEGLAVLSLGTVVGAGVFGAALALPGITGDGEPRSTRAVDGAIFAAVVLAGAALVGLAAAALARREARRPLAGDVRRRLERAAALAGIALALAAVAASAAFAHRIWGEFANPVGTQIGSGTGHLASFNSSNRWRWWQEEWSAFTAHPGLGTGAGTFHLTDLRLRTSSLVTTDEPHNTPLQFLGELGPVGLLLYLAAAAAAAGGTLAARRRARGDERAAVTALGLALAVFGLHTVVDMDWLFVASCGPLLLLAGLLLGRGSEADPLRVPPRRPLVALAAMLFAAGIVYSLSAPWLAQRALAAGLTIPNAKRAHGYDPLSTDVLTDWAALADANGDVFGALKLYRDAVALEPESSSTWWALGSFYYGRGAWPQAYDALSKAWRYDRHGPAGEPCGLLDQARHKALGVWPASCPRGSRPAASP